MQNNDKQLITIKMTEREKERYEAIRKLSKGKSVASEVAKQLSLSVRQVQRIKKAVDKHGLEGVIHGNRGKPSNRKIDQKTLDQATKLIKKRYHDFGPTLANEQLEEKHKIILSTSCVRNLMIAQDIWKPKPRKNNKEYRSWRLRKECAGEMEQFDGSYHDWFEGRLTDGDGEIIKPCLLAAIDDATGHITKLQFADNESVKSVFTFWMEYICDLGKPVSIYLDKYSTYKNNHPSAIDNSELITQFQRASKQLDIHLITAHSPQAKGRVERLFATLQDRLAKELRLRNISTIAKANKFLVNEFVTNFNKKFGVVPAKSGNVHRQISAKEKKRLPAIFAIHDQRKVQNDFTVRFKNQWFQLSEKQPTTVYKKNEVLIEERLDNSIHICLNDKYLDYTVLPERPKKTHTVKNVPLPALTNQKAPWIPPANHPWRSRINADIEKQTAKKQALINN